MNIYAITTGYATCPCCGELNPTINVNEQRLCDDCSTCQRGRPVCGAYDDICYCEHCSDVDCNGDDCAA